MYAPTHRHAIAKGEKLAHRLAQILALLHQNDVLDKHQLAKAFSVDVRTIERDLGERLQGIAERSTEGRWQLVRSARSTVPVQHLRDYARLTGTEHLFPDPSLRYLLEQLETPEPQRSTQVQPTQQEDLATQNPHAAQVFALLQNAIKQRHECQFTYKAKVRHAQPYRLIHKNGVWYLSAVEGERLKNFSVALISALTVADNHPFTPDPAHQEYINAKDDVWFTESTTEVLLRVAPEVAHYFTRRALLPRQQQHADTDGSLLVTTHINHPSQLLPVVRYWLPHVRIVQPVAWHETVIEELRQALALWSRR